MTAPLTRERRGPVATRSRPFLFVAALASIPGMGPDPVVAQELPAVYGRVVDNETLAPLDGATVRLTAASGSARETITGPDGAFRFPQVEAGVYMLSARRFGYGVFNVPLPVEAVQFPPLRLQLIPQAIPLEPLDVEVEGRPPRLVETGFYDRMEEGWGVFIEPPWIESNRRGVVRMSDFVPFLQGRAPRSRCAQVPVYLDRRRVGAAGGTGTSRSHSLNPAGTFRSAGGPPPNLLQELSATDLGAAELYQAGSKMPFFAWNDTTMACGAIVLWSNWRTAMPEIPQIEVELCEPAGRPGEVAVNGSVEDGATQVRLPAAHVFAVYANPLDPTGFEHVESVVRTDARGRYRLCGVPADVTLELTPAYGPHRGATSKVVAEAGVEARLTVTVSSPG